MSGFSKRIVIAGRNYPLTIKKEEEESVEKASVLLNNIIKNYEENYAVKDKQDLLAMCLIHVATKLVEIEKKSTTFPIEERLLELEAYISDYLEKEESKEVLV